MDAVLRVDGAAQKVLHGKGRHRVPEDDATRRSPVPSSLTYSCQTDERDPCFEIEIR